MGERTPPCCSCGIAGLVDEVHYVDEVGRVFHVTCAPVTIHLHTCDKNGVGECSACAERDCPHDEPLHYHHDGCPACSFDTEPPEPSSPLMIKLTRRADATIFGPEAVHLRRLVKQGDEALRAVREIMNRMHHVAEGKSPAARATGFWLKRLKALDIPDYPDTPPWKIS